VRTRAATIGGVALDELRASRGSPGCRRSIERDAPPIALPAHGRTQYPCRSERLIRSTGMAAYLIADIDVTDAQTYERYKNGVGETIAAFGGRYVARGGATVVLEGDWTPKRLVIVEFPSMARLHEWYESPKYRPFLELRKRASVSRLVALEGL
jgi:uncharacterized protein (DUF1330 family)